jgi:hypothetical protein
MRVNSLAPLGRGVALFGLGRDGPLGRRPARPAVAPYPCETSKFQPSPLCPRLRGSVAEGWVTEPGELPDKMDRGVRRFGVRRTRQPFREAVESAVPGWKC